MMSSISKALIDRAMNRKAHQIGLELRSGLVDLVIISRVAPMLGFLGAVLSVLAVVCSAVHPPDNWTVSSEVSRGIYFGLMPMLLGWGVGLLAGLGHLYLRGQADTLSAQITGPELEAPIAPGVLGFVERAMERKARLIGLTLENRLHHLAIIASTGPLLGIFGTVSSTSGGCFRSVDSSRSAILAYVTGCLGDNLIWTLVGLLIGIIAMFAHRSLLAQADALKAEMLAISPLLLNSLPTA